MSASAIIEESGPGWFAPARPRPPVTRLKPLKLLRAARHSLLSVWLEGHYQPLCGSGRLLGRQVVLVNTPEAVKHVMVTAHENYERKSPQMRRALEHLLGDGLFISDGETWKKRRPLVADIMHKSRLPVFGRSMEEAIAGFATRWETRDQPFDVLTDMAELTASIIARAVFGNELGAAAAEDVVTGFAGYQKLIDSFNLGYFLGLNEGMPILRTPRLSRAVRRVHGVIEKVIEDHLAGHGEARSMVDLLVRRQQKNPALGLDVSALRNEAATIFMAGHETTATTLTWAWYLLGNAPWVEKKLLAELAEVCGDRAPTVADVPRLNWSRAVIEETLRLYPPVPFLARQAKARDRIGDVEVEPAALVVISPWLLHRAKWLWMKPHRFLPERFINRPRPEAFAYIPFSAGPRMCAGLAFGLTEAILCLASLAQRFKVQPVPGQHVEPVCRLSLRPLGGLKVTVAPR